MKVTPILHTFSFNRSTANIQISTYPALVVVDVMFTLTEQNVSVVLQGNVTFSPVSHQDLIQHWSSETIRKSDQKFSPILKNRVYRSKFSKEKAKRRM